MMAPSSIKTLVELLRTRADTHGTRLAFTYLKDGEEVAAAWTYQELDRRARRVAVALQESGSDGDRALLIYEPGLDFVAAFFGCLYANRVAVPTAPPSPSRLSQALPRLRSILESAEPRTLLTSAAIAPLADAFRSAEPAMAGVRILATEGLAEGEDRWREPGVAPDTLAFLQYTSGSTALPKGVMVSHSNLLHNMTVIAQAYGSSDETPLLSWLPVYHDMGLIGCVLHPILCGSSNVLMSPAAFLQRPLRWLQAVSRFRVHSSGGSNFAYDLCVRRTTPEQRSTLDLRSWRVAFNGAEPVRARTVTDFTRAFEPHGFRPEAMSPCYGLAEATLFVSGGVTGTRPTIVTCDSSDLERGRATSATSSDASARNLVGCGSPTTAGKLLIVDPEHSTPLADGEIGEIWLAGHSVANGYWGLPEETQQTFQATLADSGSGPFLRTGDLGFLQAGQLVVAGRLKDLIIIDGRNHYPQDIELTIEQSHSAFRPGCCAAFSIEADGIERVVAVAEADPNRTARDDTSPVVDPKAAILRAARRAVADNHNVELHALVLTRPGTIAKTSSGKIRRQTCRSEFLAGSLQPW
jgi:acyl-CoA synthetase (AMP-forming)/AMP-acid ligase II